MKSAVLFAQHQHLVIRDDVTLTNFGAHDVHVKLVSSGVCHSDLSMQNGTLPERVPMVLGHEGAGTILEVGSAVTELKAGDPCIVSMVPACRVCKPCLRGQANLCEASGPMLAAQHFVVDGQLISAISGCGTFSEEMIVPESAIIKVDDDIPLDIVSLIGCGVMTGVGASINTAQIKPGSSVVVFGCGGIGISAIQGARIAGAAEILAVDLAENKFELAKSFGATHVCTPDYVEDMKQQITGGEGFDYALECIGHPITIRATYDAARRGGTAVIVGVGKADQILDFNAYEMFFGDKSLKGSMYGSSNVRVDIPKLLRLWKTGKLNLEGMVSQRIKLEEINHAFRAMAAGEVIRSVIQF